MNDKWIIDIKRKADSYERKAPDDMLDNIKQEMAYRGLTMTPPHSHCPDTPSDVATMGCRRLTGSGRWRYSRISGFATTR